MSINDHPTLPANIEANPCPWCGVTEHLAMSNNGENYFVICRRCGANGPAHIEDDEILRERTVRLWNDVMPSVGERQRHLRN